MIAPALSKVAERLSMLAAQLEAGHPIEADDLRTEVRRLYAQVEMIEEGIAEGLTV